MNNKIDKTLRNVGIITLTIVAILGLQVTVKNIYTDNVIERCAKEANHNDYANGTIMEAADWWGNPIKIYRVVADDNTAVTYAAVSAGNDGEYETADDFVCESIRSMDVKK